MDAPKLTPEYGTIEHLAPATEPDTVKIESTIVAVRIPFWRAVGTFIKLGFAAIPALMLLELTQSIWKAMWEVWFAAKGVPR